MKTASLSILLVCLLSGFSMAEELVSRDKKFSIAIPPGWQAFQPQNATADGGIVLQDSFPLTVFLTSEQSKLQQVIKNIETQLRAAPGSSPTIKVTPFQSATGLKGQLVTVNQTLAQPGSSVFQYYFLFEHGKTTYALICNSGIVSGSEGPIQAFQGIAQTARIR